MTRRYFKIVNAPCCNVSDTSFFICKTHPSAVYVACPCRIHDASGIIDTA